MANGDEAQKGVEKFHGYELEGRALAVNIARPREERAPPFISATVAASVAAATVAAGGGRGGGYRGGRGGGGGGYRGGGERDGGGGYGRE